MDDIDDDFGHWLAGFFDGEGSFCIGRRKPKVSDPLIYYYCYASIKLRCDDRPILEEIQCRTGLGCIYTNKARGTSKTGSHWLVTSKADCAIMVNIFDKYPLRAKKVRDYVVWREAVFLWVNQPIGHRWKGQLIDRRQWEVFHKALYNVRQYVGNESETVSVPFVRESWDSSAEPDFI